MHIRLRHLRGEYPVCHWASYKKRAILFFQLVGNSCGSFVFVFVSKQAWTVCFCFLWKAKILMLCPKTQVSLLRGERQGRGSKMRGRRPRSPGTDHKQKTDQHKTVPNKPGTKQNGLTTNGQTKPAQKYTIPENPGTNKKRYQTKPVPTNKRYQTNPVPTNNGNNKQRFLMWRPST